MKKKFIAVSMVLGALALSSTTLTSCVDDNESASVTKIRDAKAAQLNALATLSTEQANATKIQAEAKAAIDNAIAAYKQALADKKQTEADIAKATLQTDIQAAEAKAEANLKRQQADLEKAKAELAAQLDALADEQLATADHIMLQMDELIGDIHELNTNIIAKQFKKATAEYNLANLNIMKEEEINDIKVDSAKYEALIDEYEKYSKEVTAKEEAQKAADAATQEHTILSAQLEEVEATKNAAKKNTDDAYNKLAQTEFLKVVLRNPYYAAEDIENTPETEEYVLDFGDGTVAPQDWSYNAKMKIDEEAVETLEENIATYEKSVTVATLALTEANKALSDKIASEEYKAAAKVVDDAKKAYDDAKTSADKETAWNTLQAAESSLAAVIQNETNAVESAEEQKKLAESTLESAKATQSILNNKEAYDTYSKLYDEYVAVRKAEKEATDAYLIAKHNVEVKEAVATNLQAVADGITDYANLISECQKEINKLMKEHTYAEKVANKEELIAYYQQQIDQWTAEIETKNKLYTQYETALAQVFDGQTPVVPETPAEGEETPAE